MRKDAFDASHSSALPPEFKQGVVEMVRSGRSFRDVAESLRVSDQTLRNWVKLDRHKRVHGLTSAEREELLELCRRVKRLEMERDLLKRAAACFAKETEIR